MNPTPEQIAQAEAEEREAEAFVDAQWKAADAWLAAEWPHATDETRAAVRSAWTELASRQAAAGLVAAEPPGLTDDQIQVAVFAVLRRWNDDRAWDRYTRESGPYDVTSLRPEVLEIIKAVLAVARGVQARIAA